MLTKIKINLHSTKCHFGWCVGITPRVYISVDVVMFEKDAVSNQKTCEENSKKTIMLTKIKINLHSTKRHFGWCVGITPRVYISVDVVMFEKDAASNQKTCEENSKKKYYVN